MGVGLWERQNKIFINRGIEGHTWKSIRTLITIYLKDCCDGVMVESEKIFHMVYDEETKQYYWLFINIIYIVFTT